MEAHSGGAFLSQCYESGKNVNNCTNRQNMLDIHTIAWFF